MYSLKIGADYDTAVDVIDYGFYVQSHPVFSPPEIQTKTIEVPGRNGLLNLTQSLDGLTHYNNRTISIPLIYPDPDEASYTSAFSKLQNALHGAATDLWFTDDEGYYWVAFLSMGAPSFTNGYFTVTLTADAEPFKYERFAVGDDWLWDPFDFEIGTIRDENDLTFTVSGATDWTTFTVDAGDMPVNPTLTVSGASSLYIRSYPLSGIGYIDTELYDGTCIAPGFMLKNEWKFSLKGTGTVALSFRGGSL